MPHARSEWRNTSRASACDTHQRRTARQLGERGSARSIRARARRSNAIAQPSASRILALCVPWAAAARRRSACSPRTCLRLSPPPGCLSFRAHNRGSCSASALTPRPRGAPTCEPWRASRRTEVKRGSGRRRRRLVSGRTILHAAAWRLRNLWARASRAVCEPAAPRLLRRADRVSCASLPAALCRVSRALLAAIRREDELYDSVPASVRARLERRTTRGPLSPAHRAKISAAMKGRAVNGRVMSTVHKVRPARPGVAPRRSDPSHSFALSKLSLMESAGVMSTRCTSSASAPRGWARARAACAGAPATTSAPARAEKKPAPASRQLNENHTLRGCCMEQLDDASFLAYRHRRASFVVVVRPSAAGRVMIQPIGRTAGMRSVSPLFAVRFAPPCLWIRGIQRRSQ